MVSAALDYSVPRRFARRHRKERGDRRVPLRTRRADATVVTILCTSVGQIGCVLDNKATTHGPGGEKV
ncbi:hypothetical protein Pan14r_14640 [Crateriforma conspicua]|uniref:Uncharacterized protein n=1 Tax=Crateriforma conspicua TaxID=2527996 RepID=A0A5C5Y305_9PLAN|nr:hypothetical protein Mal65_29650 [Crateriforma conspicua]TWT69179.1 hypothetical protein Pan14r_14640 [Crateriforma conspicua]